MCSVFDVAAYILGKTGPMPAMKLHKLLYYGQAWSLVWDERPLFEETIEAWANGPVVRALYEAHEGQFEIASLPGQADALDDKGRETVDAVLQGYGHRTSQYLSDLIHMEEPWQQARQGMSSRERGNRPITLAALHEYYASLPPSMEVA